MSTLPNVLALDVAGNPNKWITYEKVAYYEAKDLIHWKMGIKNYEIHGGTNAVTGLQSTMDINTIISVGEHNLLSKNPTIYNRVAISNDMLFRRDHHVCAYCGTKFTAKHLTRDHVHPVSKGGPNAWENIVTACSGCNKYKDNHLLKDINMDLLYVPYAPSRSEALILKNKNILGDQMEFLLSRVKNKESRVFQLVH